jgi:hypothetical protein
VKDHKKGKMRHKGRSPKLSSDHQEHIIEYYEQLRDRGIPVSSHSLAAKLLRVAPEMNDVPVSVLCRCMLHVLKNIYITHHTSLNHSQGTKHMISTACDH